MSPVRSHQSPAATTDPLAVTPAYREHRRDEPRTSALPPLLAATLLASACDVTSDAVGYGSYPEEATSAQEAARTDSIAPDRAVNSAVAYLAQPRFAGADLVRGELLSLACVVCHTLGPGESHLAGPNLHGVFGRMAGSAGGFAYSAALQEAGIVWTPDELDLWLAEPDDFVPGNNMVFAGYRSASDRTELLAYLLHATGAGIAAPIK